MIKNFKEKCALTGIYLVIFAIVLLLIFGAWELKRWFNWKFGYGPKVEARIEQVEKRVKTLEENQHEHYDILCVESSRRMSE